VLTGFSIREIARHVPIRFSIFHRSPLVMVINLQNYEGASTRSWKGYFSRASILRQARLILAIISAGVLAYALTHIAKQRYNEYLGTYGTYRIGAMKQLEELRHFQGEVYMTNINAPLVGFLLNSPGFGVCSPDSIAEDSTLDLKQCKIAFMRRYQYWLNHRPKYFIFFWDGQFFPGFADCVPTGLLLGQERGGENCNTILEAKLELNFKQLFKNKLFSVFDLDH
jgi:hypothetical protein